MDKKEIKELKGEIIIRSQIENLNNFTENVLKTENYLNDKIATKIYKKFGIAIRFHL